MVVNYLELYARVRDELYDQGGDTGAPPAGYTYYWEYNDSGCLWKNIELVRYAESSINEITSRRPITDYESVSFKTRVGTRRYAVDPSILFITRVHLKKTNGASVRLTKTTEAWLDMSVSDWENKSGDPIYYMDKYHSHEVALIPTPIAVEQVYMSVGRTIQDTFSWSNRNNEISDMDPQMIRAVIEGIKMYAYLKRDSDTFNDKLAKTAKESFDSLVGPVRSLDRQWARRMSSDRADSTSSTAKPF